MFEEMEGCLEGCVGGIFQGCFVIVLIGVIGFACMFFALFSLLDISTVGALAVAGLGAFGILAVGGLLFGELDLFEGRRRYRGYYRRRRRYYDD